MSRVDEVVTLAGDKESGDKARRDVLNWRDVFEAEVGLGNDRAPDQAEGNRHNERWYA